MMKKVTFKNTSMLAIGLAIPALFACHGEAVYGAGEEAQSGSESWIARVLTSSKADLERMGLKLEGGGIDYIWIAKAPRKGVESALIEIGENGKVEYLALSLEEDAKWRDVLTQCGLSSIESRPYDPNNPSGLHVVFKADGLPAGWSFFASKGYVGFLSPKRTALFDLDNRLSGDVFVGDWLRRLPVKSMKQIFERLGKPSSFGQSAGDSWGAGYSGSGEIASLNFQFFLRTFEVKGDVAPHVVNVHLRDTIQTADQAFRVLGLTGAKLGRVLNQKQNIYAVEGAGIPVEMSHQYENTPAIEIWLPHDNPPYGKRTTIRFQFVPKQTQ